MNEVLYPFYVKLSGNEIILIWFSSDIHSGNGDQFLKTEKNSLFIAKDIEGVKTGLGPTANQIKWDDTAAVLDIDEFFAYSKNLESNEFILLPACKCILDAWNFFEDLLNTFQAKDKFLELKTPSMNKFYQKIFWGNNLAAVTPKGEHYNPVFTEDEIIEFQEVMAKVWDFLLPEFQNKFQ